MTILATTPYCRACGWDYVARNANSDVLCDSCGDTLYESQGAAKNPPTLLAAVGGSLIVTFTFTVNPLATTADFRHQTDGGAFTVVSPATSPQVIAGLEGEVISGQVRSVTGGIAGPWSLAAADTVLA